jgi:hypothetical protein
MNMVSTLEDLFYHFMGIYLILENISWVHQTFWDHINQGIQSALKCENYVDSQATTYEVGWERIQDFNY